VEAPLRASLPLVIADCLFLLYIEQRAPPSNRMITMASKSAQYLFGYSCTVIRDRDTNCYGSGQSP
jgi:hypothetical protein